MMEQHMIAVLRGGREQVEKQAASLRKDKYEQIGDTTPFTQKDTDTIYVAVLRRIVTKE
jgi:hypothetical protein